MEKAVKASIADQIIERIREVCPDSSRVYALHEPQFMGREWDLVRECLDSGWVSSLGTFVERFEEQLQSVCGVRHAVACVNGTAALHTCLLLAGVERGDEVLVPALTFVATANSVAYCGATPHFVDSELSTLGASPGALLEHLNAVGERKGGVTINRVTARPIKALIAMHTFGCPADLDELEQVCRSFEIALIEDAAESLGSLYKGRHTGAVGRLSALSFNGNKIVTTGGGGAVLTNDAELASKAKHLTTTARAQNRQQYYHDQVAYNYRLPNINAALGCAQLERLPDMLDKKRSLAKRYAEVFSDFHACRIFQEPSFASSNYWLNTLLLEDPDAELRDLIVQASNAQGIMTRPAWTLMHRLPMYRSCPRMQLTVAEDLEARIINLPSSPSIMN